LKTVNVIILSGSCCSPSLVSVDDKIQTRITELAEKGDYQVNFSTVAISTAFGGVGVSKDVDQFIRGLISEKGMSVLPVVIFNGNVAFYGGLASAVLIEEKLKECTCD